MEKTISPKAFAEAFGLGTAIKFAVILAAIIFIGTWAADQIAVNSEQHKRFIVLLIIVLYFFYAIAKGNMYEGTQRHKRKVQSLESELQSLTEKTQTLGADERTLSEKVQTLLLEKRTLESEMREQGNRLVDLSQSLESEKASAKRALASYEAVALETAQATLLAHNKALASAKNEGLQWQRKYETLRGEVDRATAEKELQSLRASASNRKSGMKNKVWTAELRATHATQLATLREAGIDTTGLEIEE